MADVSGAVELVNDVAGKLGVAEHGPGELRSKLQQAVQLLTAPDGASSALTPALGPTPDGTIATPDVSTTPPASVDDDSVKPTKAKGGK
jgi:hypothetical protein